MASLGMGAATMKQTLIGSALSLALLAGGQAMAASVDGERAWAQPDTAAMAEFRDRAYPERNVSHVRLGPVAESDISALKHRNSEPGRKALQIGLHRPLASKSGASALQWHPAPEGGMTARLALTSPGAAALRVGLDIGELPEGIEFRFAGTATAAPAPMFDRTTIDRMAKTSSRVWTPVTEGDTQLIEIHAAAGTDTRWLRFDVAALSHLLVSPSRPIDRSKIGESEQPCMVDANCVANPPADFLAAKDAVASMVFETAEGASVCTGTLLADTVASSQIPYFFSAAHCFTDQATASTLTTIWFYESTSCGSGIEAATTRQVAGGAQLLYADAASDVLFVRLNNPAPAGSTFLGWDSSQVAVDTEFLAIHHPAGDAKKFSVGVVTGLAGSTLASGQFIQVAFINAPTEGGSSGSGLLTQSSNGYRLRGGLLGGSSACETVGTDDPANSDDYSRFDLAFPNLQSFLQPSGGTTPPPSTVDYSGAWNNANESGWGLVMVRGVSGAYGMFLYHYAQDRTPSWYLSFGGLTGNVYSAPVLTFNGPWFGTVPFNATQVTNAPSGTMNITFTSATTANLQYTIDGRPVTTTISKLVF